MNMHGLNRTWLLLLAFVFALSQIAILGCWPDDENEDEEDEDEDTGDLCAIPPGEDPQNAVANQETQDQGEFEDVPFDEDIEQ